MQVKIVSITQSLVEGESMTAEQLIVYTARVSNPGNQMNHETAPKLLSYLMRKQHWSPLEMADMTIEITTSRAIAAQILRHRSFSFQEFSQRYAEVTDMEPIEVRKQGVTNRQSSTEVFDPKLIAYKTPVIGDFYYPRASEVIDDHLKECQSLYNELIERGVAKEVARMVLPLTTQTKIYMKGSIRSWVHYLMIRCDEHVQLEHRQVAEAIKEIFVKQFPNISAALWNPDLSQ